MTKSKSPLRRGFCLLLCLVVLLGTLPVTAFAAEPTELLRVGWYTDSYHTVHDNGERSGYGYEYEQAVAAYTGWRYDYVEGGWSELLDKLQTGEIDLMGGVSYTDERAQVMLFSELPMGEEKYYLYADLVNTDISASDLSTLNGKRIGLLQGSVQETQFYAWEAAHDLNLQYVYLNGYEDAKQCAAEHKIDCVISTETPLWVENGMSAIATVGSSDIYFVLSQDRPDLKTELDNAMRKMEYDKPFYADELYQRYLSAVSSPILSTDEQDWLAQHGSLRIGFLNNDAGISNYNPSTGALIGVVTDYVQFASDCLSNQPLEFTLHGFDSMEEEIQALKDGEIDLIFHFTQNPYIAAENDFVLSNTVLSLNMAAITAENYFNETTATRVALEEGNLLYQWYLSYYYPSWEIVPCASRKDAEKAVLNGDADCFIAESGEVAQYTEHKQLHSVFLMQPGNTAFAVRRGDTILMSILNKTLRTLPSSMLTGALSTYDAALQKVTVADFIKDNLLVVSGTFLAVFLCVLLLILSFLRKSMAAEAKAKQAAAQSQELNRQLQISQKELQTALQAAETASKAKTEFLSNMSHDIRTPMNAIVGLTSLMEADLTNTDRVRDYLGKLKASSRHLLNLINEILDMNKIESGKATLHVEPFHLPDEIAQVENVIRPQAKERDQQFLIRTHDIQNTDIEGDATRLRQVLLNILSNAVKYTDNGGHIELDITELPRDGHYARYKFTVTDNGIGMSEEFQKHIYESFTRAENSVTNRVQGTGLGMAITKSIVDMMGGAISLESQLGKGSRFEVMLEFKIDEQAASSRTQPAPEALPDAKSLLKGLHFLCAEDNEINAEILEAILEMEGASCTLCRNGAEIVEAFQTVTPGQYDAILMDVQMPVMDGYEATRAIRNGGNPLGKTIPIFAMTANAFSEDIQKSYDAGMDAHLSKPVDITALAQTLLKFLRTPPRNEIPKRRPAAVFPLRTLPDTLPDNEKRLPVFLAQEAFFVLS